MSSCKVSIGFVTFAWKVLNPEPSQPTTREEEEECLGTGLDAAASWVQMKIGKARRSRAIPHSHCARLCAS